MKYTSMLVSGGGSSWRYVGRGAGEVRRGVRAPLRAVRALADAGAGVGGADDLRPAGAIGRGVGRGVGGESGLHKPDDAVPDSDEPRPAVVQARGKTGLFPHK